MVVIDILKFINNIKTRKNLSEYLLNKGVLIECTIKLSEKYHKGCLGIVH